MVLLLTKGKWYWEVRVTGVGGSPYLGIQRRGESRNGYTGRTGSVYKQSW